MGLIERYNKELKGCRFKISTKITDLDIFYMLDDHIGNGVISISWCDNGIQHGTAHIDEVFKFVDNRLWILDKNDDRKKKIHRLISIKSV